MTFRLYADQGLSVPLAGLQAQFPASGGATRRVCYLGSRDQGRRLVGATENSGVLVQVTGPGAAAIRMASSAAGLAAAVPGGSLDLGTVSGVTAIHIEFAVAVQQPGALDATITISAMEEAKA